MENVKLDLDAVLDSEWGRSMDGCIRWDMGIKIAEGEGAVLRVNVEHPIVTSEDFVA